jgi:hypothetical protein
MESFNYCLICKESVKTVCSNSKTVNIPSTSYIKYSQYSCDKFNTMRGKGGGGEDKRLGDR